ncbi:MAG: hypothetical protein MJ007_01935 [Paludibacteraceae bacterium]|nr:hypothetical protein [Paludibacteraceae bacterium]
MDDVKGMILSDAIRTAIESAKKVEKLKRIITISIGANVVLLLALLRR